MTDLFPSRDTPLTDPLAAAFPAEIREDVSGVSALSRGWSRLMRPGPRPVAQLCGEYVMQILETVEAHLPT